MKNFIYLIAFFALFVTSCEKNELSPVEQAEPTIASVVSTSAEFSILLEALNRTNLVETLNSEDNQFTVFAPTNAAFQNFLNDNSFNSLDDIPNDVLTSVLLNHVLSGSVSSSQVQTGYVSSLASANNNNLSLFLNASSGVEINGISNVIQADINANNGIIHKVDTVIGLPTIVNHSLANPNFSILVEALTRSDFGSTYVDILSGTTNAAFTVFAPTNDAFLNTLTVLGLTSLDEIPTDLLEQILNYHVVVGANVKSTDLTDDAMVMTFQGEEIMIDLDNGAQVVDASGTASNIILADVQASNGIIHALDRVILPQSAIDVIDPTIAGFVANDPNFSILLDAVSRAGLVDVLNSDDNNFTVFAPTNDAFNTFLTNNGFSSLDDIPTDVLTQTLLNHVLDSEVFSNTLSTTYTKTLATESSTNNMIDMYINTSSGVRINNIADVTIADVDVRNGVIHVVDNVIPLPTIVTFATADSTFGNLASALTRSDLTIDFVGTLSGNTNAPFTVFAPTNDAFGDLLNELSLSSLNDIPRITLEQTLLYHVVSTANVISTNLTEGMNVGTLQGSNFTIGLSNGAQITDTNGRIANIIVTDVQTNNGIIHVIDKVILP